MSDEKKNIDKLFEQGLKTHEEKAPPHAWSMLDSSLNKKSRIRTMRIVRYAAASVLILLAFFVGQEFGNTDLNQNGDFAQDTKPSESSQTQNVIAPNLVAEIQIPPREPSAKTGTKEITKNIREESNPVLSVNQEVRGVFPVNSLLGYEAGQITQSFSQFIRAPEKYLNSLLQDEEMVMVASNDFPVKEKTPSGDQWKLGGFFSPVYSYRTTENQSFGLFDNSYKSNTNGPGSFEQGQINFAAGITAEYDLNRKWTVESGFFYSRMGQSKNGLVFENKPNNQGTIDLSTSAGKIDGSKLPVEIGNQIAQAAPSENDEEFITNGRTDTELHQQFDFVEIPILFKYRVYQEEVSINLISGVTSGIMVNNSSVVEINGQKSNLGSTQNLRKFLYSSVVGFGMRYEISQGLYLNLEPTFKYALHSMNPSDEYKYKPYSLGVNTGISFGF
jgi:hypothetical protein